jgi:hypothetical protein
MSKVRWRISILVTIMALIMTIESISFAAAQENHVLAYMGVSPSNATNLKSTDTFTVKIYINSTAPFVAYQFCLYWNRTYMNATSLTDTPPAAWIPFCCGYIHWNYSEAHGRILRGVVDTHKRTDSTPLYGSPLLAVAGNFTVATITFNVLMDLPPSTVVALYLDCTRTCLADSRVQRIEPICVCDNDVHIMGENTTYVIPTTRIITNSSSILDDIRKDSSFWSTYRESNYIQEPNTSLNDVITLISSIPTWIVLIAFAIIAIVVVTLSISLTYCHNMRVQDKHAASCRIKKEH